MGRKYTQEQEEFCVQLKQQEVNYKQIMERFKEEYGTKIPESSLKDIIKRKGYMNAKKVFEQWHIDLIRKEFDAANPVKSIKEMANKTGLDIEQIRNKVSYLGLWQSREQAELNSKDQDVIIYQKRIENLKDNIKVNMKVKVKYTEHSVDSRKIKTAEVLSIHPKKRFITVLVNGHRESYRYDEILEVL